jgi:hypothetical protein
MKRTLTFLLVLLGAALLGGCATSRIVDSEVTAFSSWPAAPAVPGTSYRFERLPSQQGLDGQQERIEAIAQGALARVGLVLVPDSARLSVQVSASTQRVQRFVDDGFLLGGPGVYGGYGYGGFGYGGPFGAPFNRFGELYYLREVSLQVRELASNKVVYETKARHDGPWSDTFTLLPAMFEAALLGFPQPPPGTRRVDVTLPR